jgi:hypothetical protein
MNPGETGRVLSVSSDEDCPRDKDGWSCTSRARRGTLTVFVSFEMPDGSTRICSSRSMRYTALPPGTRFSAREMTFLDGERSSPPAGTPGRVPARRP